MSFKFRNFRKIHKPLDTMKTFFKTKLLHIFILLCAVNLTGCSADLEQNSKKQDAVDVQNVDIKTSLFN